MVATCFRREFAAFLDEVPELGLSTLELPALVPGRDPVRDLAFRLRPVSYFFPGGAQHQRKDYKRTMFAEVVDS